MLGQIVDKKMRTWLVILGFMVLLPAIGFVWVAVNIMNAFNTWNVVPFAYLAPGIVLTVLGFKTSPKVQPAKTIT